MNGFREDPARASADLAVERALRNVTHRSPRPEFLRDLKAQFTAVAHDAPQTSSVEPRRATSWRWGIPVGVLAAAAAVLAVVALRSSHTARWSPVDGRAPRSPIVVDGRSVAPDRLAHAVADQTRSHAIVTDAEPLMLWIDGRVCAEVAPRSEVDLGAVSSDGSELVLSVRKGTLRMCTGPDFAGSKLSVKTPQFDVAVTGTSFAIDVDDDGTCVCCLHGSVQLMPSAKLENPWKVDAGRMCRIYNDDRAPKWDALSANHGPPLKEFDGDADSLLEK